VGELREDIRQDLHARREAKQQDDVAEQLLHTILQQAEIDSSPTFVNRELDSMLRRLAYDLQEQGFTLDGYLRTTGRTVEDLVEEFRPTAEKRVGKSLILAQLVKEEGLQVEDSDIEQEVARMTREYGQAKEALREALLGNEQMREEIRNRLYGRKVVQRLAGPPEATEGQEEKVGSVVIDGEESSSDKDTSPEAAESA
jgi:trigger factor